MILDYRTKSATEPPTGARPSLISARASSTCPYLPFSSPSRVCQNLNPKCLSCWVDPHYMDRNPGNRSRTFGAIPYSDCCKANTCGEQVSYLLSRQQDVPCTRRQRTQPRILQSRLSNVACIIESSLCGCSSIFHTKPVRLGISCMRDTKVNPFSPLAPYSPAAAVHTNTFGPDWLHAHLQTGGILVRRYGRAVAPWLFFDQGRDAGVDESTSEHPRRGRAVHTRRTVHSTLPTTCTSPAGAV